MAGRHDKAGDDPSPGLMLTGPIAIRGLSRGVRGALRPGSGSRHRAAAAESRSRAQGLVAEGDAAGDSGADDLRLRTERADREDGADVREEADVSDRDPERSERSAGDADQADDARPDPAETSAEQEADADAAESPRGPAEPAASGTGRSSRGSDPDQRGRAPRRQRPGSAVVGLIVLVVLALICAGLITAVVVKTRNDAALAAREAADYTPPPLTTAGPGADAPVIAVVGDEGATRSASGVGASQRWPALVAAALDGKADVAGSAGAGYVASGADGDTFVQAAADVPSDADVVVFVGGAADVNETSIDLAKAATRAYAAAAGQAPGAVVIAVGPLFVLSGEDADEVEAVRTTLQSSARIADIRWVDPIRSKWLQDVDGTADLTATTERTIATRMRSVVGSEAG